MDLFGLPDFFAPGVAAAFVLTALRVGGLLLIAPAWSAKSVPMKLRTALLVVFATLLLPSATVTAQLDSIAITPAMLAAVAAGTAVMAVLGSVLPARRIARIDHDALVDAMLDAIGNRGKTKRMGEAAARQIPDMCDWSVVIRRFLDMVRAD